MECHASASCDVTNVMGMDSDQVFGHSNSPHVTVDNDTDWCLAEPIVDVLDMDTECRYHRFPQEALEVLNLKTISVLGKGSNGDVLLVENANDFKKYQFAAKVFSFKDREVSEVNEAKETFLIESGILQSLHHKNIIQIVTSAIGPSYGVIISQYYSQGPLYTQIGKISLPYMWKYFVHILSAVQYLHGKRIVHRDIKLDNILVRNKDVFLADFGLSERLKEDNDLVCGFAGTDEFVAPEVLAAKVVFDYYDGFKADAYSTGVFLWCLLMESDPSLEIKCWASLKHELDSGVGVDSVLGECARLLLLEDPKQRVTVHDMIEGLKENYYVDDMYKMLKSVGDEENIEA